MNIIIAGCGKMGIELIKILSLEKHNIVVIDTNLQVIDDISGDFDVMTVTGNSSRCDVLKEANVSKCNIFIAMTESDEVNILSCLIARKMNAKHCIARVRNPVYAEQMVFMREELGLSMMVNPEYQAAREIGRILHYPSAINIETFGRGRIDMVEFKINPGCVLADMSLKEMTAKIKVRVLVCAVQREGSVFIPSGDFILRSGDKIHFAAAHDQISKFFKITDPDKERVKSVLIVGGGAISYYLAHHITEDMGMQAKVLETDMQRCVSLSERLPRADIINADGSDHELLIEEGIDSADAFVTLTGMDEENIVLALFAKSRGVNKVVTKASRFSVLKIAESVGLDCVVSPKAITANMILQYVRARQNSDGSNVLTLYRMLDGEAEAIEFIVRQEADYVNVPIKDLRLNKNSLIASIIRDRKYIIPNGDDKLMLNDSVVVVSTNKYMRDLNDIFLH